MEESYDEKKHMEEPNLSNRRVAARRAKLPFLLPFPFDICLPFVNGFVNKLSRNAKNDIQMFAPLIHNVKPRIDLEETTRFSRII